MPIRKHESTSPLIAAGTVMVLHAVLLLTAFFLLAATFEFPGVLREPPQRILELFAANRGVVQPTYYLFTLTGLTFIGMAFLVHEALGDRPSVAGRFAKLAGVLAGITQAVGFIRWVWFVPAMAAIATDPAASEAKRQSALVLFEGLHQFAGVSVGENLSFWFQGLWTIAASIAILRHGRFDRRLAYLGIGSGLSFIVYTAEQFGGPFAFLGELNVVFHVVWLAWMVTLGLLFVRGARRPQAGRVRLSRANVALATAGALGLFMFTMVGV